MKEAPEVIGSRLRELRAAAALTQQTLAERAGIALRTLIRIEQGGGCTIGTLNAIADVLGVGLADLVTEPDRTEAVG